MRSAMPATSRQPFNWLADLILPLAVSVMEAQPLALVGALLSLALAGTVRFAPQGPGTIALVSLGLWWWALAVERLGGSDAARRRAVLLVLGWVGALLALLAIRAPELLRGLGWPQALADGALVTWFWRRATARSQLAPNDEDVQSDFKVGLGVVLGTLAIAGATNAHGDLALLLAGAVPVYFFCGLGAVSLARLVSLRAQRNATRADPTGRWLLALGGLGAAMGLAVLLLETLFSFATVLRLVAALSPLADEFATIVSWLAVIFAWLVAPLILGVLWVIGQIAGHSNGGTTTPATTPTDGHVPLLPTGPQAVPHGVVVAGEGVVIALVVFALIVLVARGLRRWGVLGDSDGVEEVREALVRAAVARPASQSPQRAADAVTLDPDSVRALYRELLLAAAARGIARAPDETPVEYRRRLALWQLHHAADPADDLVLDELTRLYRRERYGGVAAESARRLRLRADLLGTLARLFGRPDAGAAHARRRRRTP